MPRFVAFLLAISVAVPATACLWDYDTLKMERERFPGALELIVGKFLRHSDVFYEWRVKDRSAKITRHESGEAPLSDEQLAAAYDDLAVAYDKLGKHDRAITTIREKAERSSNVGEYETHANLGTFLVHSGKLEEGLAELRKAIEINPDAHFGREKYQILLVEYVLEKRHAKESAPLPLDTSIRWQEGSFKDAGGGFPFAMWLLNREGLLDEKNRVTDESAAQELLAAASQGILGMMRFGDYRSPILLETLGDLMVARDDEQLAARAYLRAAEGVDNTQSREAYRNLAEVSIRSQREKRGLKEVTLSSLEDQLAREVKEADAWFKEVAHDEELWVEASPDPDKRFWEKYGNQTIAVGQDRLPAGKFAASGLPVVIRVALGAGLVLTVLVVILALVWRKRHPTGYDQRVDARH